jgi:WD40 repeat protein
MSDFLPSQRAVITAANAGDVAALAALPQPWGVHSIAFSPDGTLLASGYEVVRLWEVETGVIQFSLQVGDGVVDDVAFSPDGTVLAAAMTDHTVRLWDYQYGIPLNALQSHRHVLRSAAFSPDGTLLAAGSGNFSGEAADQNVVHVWETRTGEEYARLEDPAGEICVVFSPDGSLLAAGDRNGSVRLWHTETFDLLRGWTIPDQDAPGGLAGLAFSPDGGLLAAGGFDRQGGLIYLWDAGTGDLLGGLPDSSEDVWSVVFSPDGTVMASGGNDRANADSAVRLWDVQTGQLLASLPNHTRPVEKVAFSPDGTLLASGGGDRVWLWGIRA